MVTESKSVSVCRFRCRLYSVTQGIGDVARTLVIPPLRFPEDRPAESDGAEGLHRGYGDSQGVVIVVFSFSVLEIRRLQFLDR